MMNKLLRTHLTIKDQIESFSGTISKSIYFISPFAFIKVIISWLHYLLFFKSSLHRDFLINFYAIVVFLNIHCFNYFFKD